MSSSARLWPTCVIAHLRNTRRSLPKGRRRIVQKRAQKLKTTAVRFLNLKWPDATQAPS